RSADRPSSDNVVNAVCAVEAAKSDVAEVLVCMHANENDHRCALHRGTRVRKSHTSRRDAFETVGRKPLGYVDYEEREVVTRREHVERGEKELTLRNDLNRNVEHVKFIPGDDGSVLEHYDDADGIVLEGTGLGHVNTSWIDTVEEHDAVFVMTSQCVEGRVCDRVYDTGRDLLDAGVVEAEDTLAETAVVKLMWALENAEKPREAMQRSIAGEITESSRPWT
ncbi:MAG: asparaginase domain-containing protein, partial [Halobacteria archaeon]|nr:asparaginase domain-containing protein [Halobacteria archaeon]